jgi:hypothetical protein
MAPESPMAEGPGEAAGKELPEASEEPPAVAVSIEKGPKKKASPQDMAAALGLRLNAK